MPGGPHVGVARRYTRLTSRAPRRLICTCHVDGGASTDHQAALGQRQLAEVVCPWRNRGCKRWRRAGRGLFIGQPQLAHGIQAQAKEHRIVLFAQFAQAEVAPQALAMAQLDTADTQQECHFPLGIIVNQLVAGDAVFIEATRRQASNTTTSWPWQASRCAQASPAGASAPPPQCACPWPVNAGTGGR